VNTRHRRSGPGVRRAAAVAFSAIAGVLAVASFAFACTVAAGSTWYSDGTRTKSGPVGTQIKAFATGAVQNVPYKLVLGNDGGDPSHSSHACMATVDILNPNVVKAASNGFISTVTGTVHSTTAKGTYQLCFKDSSVNNSTGTGGATFAVI
jgi:hypothetical protein